MQNASPPPLFYRAMLAAIVLDVLLDDSIAAAQIWR